MTYWSPSSSASSTSSIMWNVRSIEQRDGIMRFELIAERKYPAGLSAKEIGGMLCRLDLFLRSLPRSMAIRQLRPPS